MTQQEIIARVKSLPSTGLGIFTAAAIVIQSVFRCEVSLTDWSVWVPAMISLVWGLMLRGPAATK